jgi:succinate dehydrogenase/fumarate reductase flavoprotein subunit
LTKSRSCDVLILGGGSAGLRAAIEAHDAGAHVLVISKSKRGEPHTVVARGGINAALGTMDPEDNWMMHAADTLREGEFLADYERVEMLCKNAPDAINELVKWGARFHREKDGRLTQRFFGAHTYRRTVFYEDWTGQEIVRVLINQVNQRSIEIIDNVFITKLLESDDVNIEEQVKREVKGAIGIDIEKREVVVFECKSLILAAGGYTRVFKVSSSRVSENCGEGVTLAYEAGADLVDMEMVQFHPTGMVWPEKAAGTLATEAIRGEGGILLNSKGERFMKNYYPERMELGPRDVVARAVYSEIVAGRGTEHGGVWLDVTHLPKEKILDRLPTMYEQFKDLDGIDISISQIHGANRLGGNSLLDTVVFGKIAGSQGARLAMERVEKEKTGPSTRSVSNNFGFGNGMFLVKEPHKFSDKIQKLMNENVGIVREETKLKHGLKRILELKNEFYSKENILKELKIDDDENTVDQLKVSWEVKSFLVACEAIIRSALMREESRGAHYRSDFPKLDDEKWKVNIFCRNEEDEMTIFKQQVKETKGPLADFLDAHTKAEHQREFE